MRQRVLLAAAALDVRARFARQLQASGYAVELASDEKRALRLAHNNHYQVAIVASDSSPPGLELMRELRDAVPKMMCSQKDPPTSTVCVARFLRWMNFF